MVVLNLGMKCNFSNILFGNSTKVYRQGENKIVETFDDDMRLLQKIEYDKFDRDIDVKRWDEFGQISEHMHKEYFEKENTKGHIETYKNKFQEYIRKAYVRIDSDFRHSIDDFTSLSNPEKSYINDAIYDLNGEFIDIVTISKTPKSEN